MKRGRRKHAKRQSRLARTWIWAIRRILNPPESQILRPTMAYQTIQVTKDSSSASDWTVTVYPP